MSETLQCIVAKSLEIAWDYLEATSELGNPDRAAEHLLGAIESMIRQGERRPLLLSNKAIASYQRFRAERGLEIELSTSPEVGLVPCGGHWFIRFSQSISLTYVVLRGINNAPAIVSTILIPSFVC